MIDDMLRGGYRTIGLIVRQRLIIAIRVLLGHVAGRSA